MSDHRAAVCARFAAQVYGEVPAEMAPVAVPAMAPRAFGAGTIAEWRLELGAGLPAVWVLLALPARQPAPCLVGLNFDGNHLIHRDPGVRVRDGFAVGLHDPASTAAADAWSLEFALARGWAVATACCGDVQEDRADGPGLLRAWQGRYSAGAIAAWAWGLSRIADWLVGLPGIDPGRLVVAGHSRLGKAALWAGASDPRFAMVIPSQSGTGGVAPSHDQSPGGESVADITRNFPHWFAPGFRGTSLEQDAVLAAIAPRPVLVTNAVDDPWASPAGQWRTVRRAAPAWGVGLPEEMPPIGERLRGPLGWWMRPGGHAQTAAEVRTWLDAADEVLGG